MSIILGTIHIKQHTFKLDNLSRLTKTFQVAAFAEMVRGYRGNACSRGMNITKVDPYLLSLYPFVEDVNKLVEELSFIMPGAINKSCFYYLFCNFNKFSSDQFRRGNSKSGCGAFNTRLR